jgi:phosphoglycerate dehydrogenase-like enzyme
MLLYISPAISLSYTRAHTSYFLSLCPQLLHAASMGVPVFNSPYANTRSVAELVLGEMVMLARQIADRSAECHAGQWKKESKGCYGMRLL